MEFMLSKMHFEIILNHNIHMRQKYIFSQSHWIDIAISLIYIWLYHEYIMLNSPLFSTNFIILSFPCINDLANISLVIDSYKVIMSKFLGIYLNLLHLSSINAPSKPTDYSLQNKYKHCQSQVKWKMTQQDKY